MPSPFSAAKNRHKRPIPQGGLDKDLYETNEDIRRLKCGGTAEVSLEEAKAAKRAIKEKIKAEVMEEKKAMLQQLDPLQLAEPRERQKTTTA